MKDRFGREIDYLRVSVTKRCNFSCAYCGAGERGGEELSADLFARICAAFARAGVKKIRLTGGEPLMRDDIVRIAQRVRDAAAPDILALTTNGYLLENYASSLKKAGVDAVNISLDSLDRECFRRLTGRDALEGVLRGLRSAVDAGFDKIKVNAVLMRGVNDGGAAELIALAKKYPIDVRFIELMPLADGKEHERLLVTSDELLARFDFLSPVGGDGTAVEYSAPGFKGRIGFISPVTKRFCRDCRRIRLLSDGSVMPCLGRRQTVALGPFDVDDDELYERVRLAVLAKPAGHGFDENEGLSPMNGIGG